MTDDDGEHGEPRPGEGLAGDNVIPIRTNVPAYMLPEFQITTEAVASEFAKRHANRLRYVREFGEWMVFTGGRWKMDRTGRAVDLAGTLCCEIGKERPKDRKKVEMWGFVSAVEQRARTLAKLAIDADAFDRNPRILNTPTGTIELDTGEMRAHRRIDYCSKVTECPPSEGGCPLWLRFLGKITGGDDGLQTFLQRMVGYCLTGGTAEEVLFFLYGTGQNGKGTFLQTISKIMGDYATTAAIETFTAGQFEHHPEELAVLRGARLVTAVETEQNKRWSESKVKLLTGGDSIRARFMRADSFEYTPAFKLVIVGNHKPALQSVDKAIRRRLHLVPFSITIEDDERDESLKEQLKKEYPAILRWAIDGTMAFLVQGLDPPPVVRDATAEYLDSEDAVGSFIEEECRKDPQAFTASSALYASWRKWAEDRGEYIGSMRAFSQCLMSKGFTYRRTESLRGFRGIALKPISAARAPEQMGW